MKKVNVIVRLKQGVLDPQGKTVHHSLHSLDFPEVRDVRIGKFIELSLEPDTSETQIRDRVQAMCDKLLANPVIEDFEILED